MPNPAADNPLVNSTACLILYFRRPGIKRKLKKDQFDVEADEALVGASKKVIDAPEYGHVVAFAGGVKRTLRSLALPSKLYHDATYLIPLAKMTKADAFLAQAKPEWQERVDAYISAYPARFDETQKRLRNIADATDRMTEPELREAFGFDWEYVTLSTPSTLRQVSAALFEREEERLRMRLSSAEADIVGVFREQFLSLVSGMKSMLDGTDTDGKAQRFSGKRIERMQGFIEKFAEQNVCGDEELPRLLAQASGLLAGVNPKDLKNDEEWRRSLSGTFGEIGETLKTLTRVRGRRLIEVEEDEASPATA